MVFAIAVFLAGFLLYFAVEKKGQEFLLAFLLLLPLWGPRCAVIFIDARRALELRWEDAFLIALLIRCFVRGDIKLVFSRSALAASAFFLYATVLLVIRLPIAEQRSSLLYLLLYSKLVLYLAAISLYLGSGDFSVEVFTAAFIRIAKVLFLLESLGILYQVLSHDFNFNSSFGRIVGLPNWRAISGGHQKAEVRANIIFDPEPYATGITVAFLGLIAMFTSRRYLGWLLLCILAAVLSTSKTGIIAVLISAILVFFSRKKGRLLIYRSSWLIGILASLSWLSMLFLFSGTIQSFVLSSTSRLLALFLNVLRYSPKLRTTLVGFSINSLAKRIEIIQAQLSGFQGSTLKLLFGFSGYSIFDNNYLFIICVFGIFGVAILQISHYLLLISGARNLRQANEKQQTLLASMYSILSLIITVIGITGEPSRHVRTIYFIYPMILVLTTLIERDKGTNAAQGDILRMRSKSPC